MNNNNKTQNTRLKKNTFVFGILMIVCQIGIIIAYSLGFYVKASMFNVSSAINTVVLAVLVIAGMNIYIQDLDLFSHTSEDCFGLGSALHFS